MLVLSFLVHLALLYFIPGVNIFPPAVQQKYIELETILIEPETSDEQPEESPEEIEGTVSIRALACIDRKNLTNRNPK